MKYMTIGFQDEKPGFFEKRRRETGFVKKPRFLNNTRRGGGGRTSQPCPSRDVA
jgi:hypothetical protein